MKKVIDTVNVGADVLNNLGGVLLLLYSEVYLLVDENTRKHCLSLVLDKLPDRLDVEVLEVPAGEQSKRLEVAADLWRKLNEKGASRHAILVNVGGGMITDLGGFVASTYKRGIDFIHIPTSLLGMVDAAIGGKTGIDLDAAKNVVGTYKHPNFTLIYPPFLNTLPAREKIAGFAEVLKHGILTGEEELLQLLALWKAQDYEPMILAAARIKWRIVEEDFEEEGMRKILNFGHTLGHAVESYFLHRGEPILHGEAVAAGMLMESWLSMQFAGLSRNDYAQVEGIIRNEFPDLIWPAADHALILNWLRYDKKNVADVQQFALLEGMGHCTFGHEISLEQSAAALAHYRKLVASDS
jgi:3-dehydroquinate synthase